MIMASLGALLGLISAVSILADAKPPGGIKLAEMQIITISGVMDRGHCSVSGAPLQIYKIFPRIDLRNYIVHVNGGLTANGSQFSFPCLFLLEESPVWENNVAVFGWRDILARITILGDENAGIEIYNFWRWADMDHLFYIDVESWLAPNILERHRYTNGFMNFQ